MGLRLPWDPRQHSGPLSFLRLCVTAFALLLRLAGCAIICIER